MATSSVARLPTAVASPPASAKAASWEALRLALASALTRISVSRPPQAALGHFLPPHARLPPSVALGGRAVAQQWIERRTVALLAADVAGYSGFTGADEVIE
jgi:hypothetical protein